MATNSQRKAVSRVLSFFESDFRVIKIDYVNPNTYINTEAIIDFEYKNMKIHLFIGKGGKISERSFLSIKFEGEDFNSTECDELKRLNRTLKCAIQYHQRCRTELRKRNVGR